MGKPARGVEELMDGHDCSDDGAPSLAGEAS
jgi:hypothetical protein